MIIKFIPNVSRTVVVQLNSFIFILFAVALVISTNA